MSLAVRDVSKRFGGRAVVDHVSFDVEPGSLAAIAGPNGAGKSTLLRIVAGVFDPDAGAVEIDGVSIVGRRVAARRRLGYVPEAADPPGYLTPRELFDFVIALKEAPPLSAEVIEALGLDAIADTRIDRLSLGERRRTCLAAALVGSPAVLVLDEPTNGLDADGTGVLAELLLAERDRGAAILVATHDAAFASRVADVRLTMREGALRAAGEDG